MIQLERLVSKKRFFYSSDLFVRLTWLKVISLVPMLPAVTYIASYTAVD